MHPERSGFVRVGAPPRCERDQHLSASGRAFSHPGRVLLRRGDALGGTSTSSSAPRGAAHRRYAICTRNVAVSGGVGAPPRGERGGHLSASGRAFSHPGRVLLRRGDALRGTSTSSSAPRGAAHPRYAICTRNVAVSLV